jgi:WhiB family redox-sensing transcriptional regulator
MSAPVGHLRPDEFSDFEPLAFVDQPWVGEALCSQTDPEIFHPGVGRKNKAAKAVCAACPVTALCLDWAQVTKQKHGIWGGLSPDEREQARHAEVAA